MPLEKAQPSRNIRKLIFDHLLHQKMMYAKKTHKLNICHSLIKQTINEMKRALEIFQTSCKRNFETQKRHPANWCMLV